MSPPRFATWLLLTLGSGPDIEVIAGDLREQHSNHSRAWYWRQVTYAITLGVVQDLQKNWLLAIRAVVMGTAVMTVVSLLAGGLGYWILPPILGTRGTFSYVPVWLLILGVPSAASGWAIGRLHRANAIPFSTAFAFLAIQFHLLPGFVFLVRNSFEHERFRPYLWVYLSNMPLVAAIVGVAVIAGAISASRSRSALRR